MRDRALYTASIPALRAAWRLAPRRFRYFPDYVEAQRRVRGQEPRDRVGRFLEKVALGAIRPPEPYKGKGIRYTGEKITLKETKKK